MKFREATIIKLFFNKITIINMKNLYFLIIIFIFFFLACHAEATNVPYNPEIINEQRTTPQYVPYQLIVKFRESSGVMGTLSKAYSISSESSIGVLNSEYGAFYEKLLKKSSSKNLDRIYLFKFPKNSDIEKIMAEYKNDPNVEYAEPNYILNITDLYPNDPGFSKQWGLYKIHAPEAWSITTGSQNVVVGVIDTGVDYNHQDLRENIWKNPGEIPGNRIDDDRNGYIDDVYGWNFVSNNNNPMDDNEHGTHCAGVIGATGNNNLGVTGVNWKVKIAALKILDNRGSGNYADAIRAFNYANMMGIKILSNSWSGYEYSQALLDAINAVSMNDVLFIVSAGNDAINKDVFPQYPCTFNSNNIICVAATDMNDGLAFFSNFGATTVDLAAPGYDIYSTVPGNYSYMSGTSMATPFVSGVTALIKSKFPTLNANQIKARILYSTDPQPMLQGNVLTNGRLNAFRALEIDNIAPAKVSTLTFSSSTLNTITLTWTAVGDDGTMGKASFYDIRYSTSPISDANFDSAKQVRKAPVPKDSGSTETFTVGSLNMGTTYYFAMKVYDDIGNISPLSSIASGTTKTAPLPSGCDLLIDSPYTIDRNNTRYCLSQNIGVMDTNGKEIIIGFANSIRDTTLDCRGFTIYTPGDIYQRQDIGIFLNTNNNIIVKNCRLEQLWIALDSSYTDNSIFVNNVAVNNRGGLIFIDSSNIIIQDNIVYNANLRSEFGIEVYNKNTFGNITLINNVVNNGGRDWNIPERDPGNIFLMSGGINTLINNTAVNSTVGYKLICSNSILANNIANSNSVGFYILANAGEFGPNLFYNNFLNNTNNIVSYSFKNYFNTTKTLGTNIIGGPYIGGNFWSDYTGNDTSNPKDGIGDTNIPYASDYLPLVKMSQRVQIPPQDITILSPTNNGIYTKSYVPLNYVINQTTTWIGYSLDGKPNITITGPVNLSNYSTNPYPISDGTHTITVYAKDSSRKEYSSSVNFYFCGGDISGTIPGISDGRVDLKDIGFVSKYFGSQCGNTNPSAPKYNASADINDDCKVDMKDTGYVGKYNGKTCPTNSIIHATKINCNSDGTGTDGLCYEICDALPECNNLSPGSPIPYCNCPGTLDYFGCKCATCNLFADIDNICISAGSLGPNDGCTAPLQCNGRTADRSWCEGDIKKSCSPSCQYSEINCKDYGSDYYCLGNACLKSGTGGGGCPILKAWDGNDFKEIELLNIHALKDQDTVYTTSFSMQSINDKYELILHEAAYLFWDGSHINSVKLVDSSGNECRLVSAVHSKQGDVLQALKYNDNDRVKSYPGEEIKLVYDECSGNDFTFTIEGYNMKTPYFTLPYLLSDAVVVISLIIVIIEIIVITMIIRKLHKRSKQHSKKRRK